MAKIKLQGEENMQSHNQKQKLDPTVLHYAPSVTYLWLLAVLAIFPIFTNKRYEDILSSKYKYLLIVDIALIVLMGVWWIATGKAKKYFLGLKRYADPSTGKWFKNWFKASLNSLDICMVVFLVCCILATLVSSPYMKEAVTGSAGRWHGLILLSLYVITYFIISRGMDFKPKIITFFLLAAIYICFVAITDYFDMDILHFKQNIAEDSYKIFISTIGNINTFTAYAALPLAVSGILFMLNSEKIWKTILFYVVFLFATVSIIVASSDNGYLSFAAFFAFAPLAAFLSYKGIRRYFILAATFLTSIILVQHWNVKYADIVVAPEGIITALGSMSAIKVLTIVLWVIAAVLCIYDLAIKKRSENETPKKLIRNIWAVILGIGIVGLIAIVIIANKDSGNLPSALEPFRGYIVFDDHWGTNRLYVWKCTLQIRDDLPFINKLLGTGPETVGLYLDRMYDEIAAFTQQVYDSPHNELLQTLFCMGPLGLISYVGIYISVIVLATKNATKRYYPYMMAIAFACICHLSECVVNIMVPIDVAVMFALIAVAGGLFRSKEE